MNSDRENRQKWQEIIKKHPEANFLQSPEYGKMNELAGNHVILEDFDGLGWALMIIRDAKRGRYMEIPCGPLTDWQDSKIVAKIIKRIEMIAKEQHCVFVRMRPQLFNNLENLSLLKKLGLKKSPMHLAAEHTVIIDLKQSESDLMSNMRRQTRYEVRRAAKLDIKVQKFNSEQIFKDFHKTQVQTAKRQNFIPPDLKTLLAEREAFGDNINIYVAETSDGARIAYGMIIKDGLEGDYYEAASTELHYKLPGAYAIIWQAMQDLKAEGYERFNLWGIAPEGQTKHRYAGVTTFKTGFGGEVIEYVPAHDLIISPLKYTKNWAVETARRKRRHL